MVVLLLAGFAVRAPAATVEETLARAQAAVNAGDTDAALATYRALLPSLPRNARQRAEVLDELSAIETDAGDYDAAVRDAKAAADVYAALGDGRGRASSLNQAGLAQMYAGSYAIARETLGRALRIATLAGDAEGRVEELMNLASVDFYVGRYTDAAASYDLAARILDEQRAAPWTARRRRILLANRATLDQRLGRYDEALAQYRLALADTANLRPAEHAQMLVNLGVVYRRLGDPYKALAAYDEALPLFARDEQLDAELGVLKNRGIVLALDLGRLVEARATFADAFARATASGNAREALQARLYGAETELRLRNLTAAAREFRAALDEARRLETVEEQWKALYGLARCELALRDVDAAEQHLRAALDVIETIREGIRVPSLKSDFFNDKREVFDAFIALRLQRKAGARELFELIERGRSRGWRDRLRLPAHVELAAVQRALPDDALLLDFWTSSSGSAVIAIGRTSAAVRAISVDTAAVRALADALPRGAASAWRAPASTIARGLLPPLPAAATHLAIVTDGALASIPFELLPEGERLLIERHDVTYLPTAALLLRGATRIRRFAAPWSVQFRGFADPLFRSAALDDPRDVRARLAGSAREVRDVASELGGASRLYLGANDRKAYLDEQDAPPLLHIASHAFVDSGAIEQSRILFSPANAAGAADYLFLKEAYDLPFAQLELAVLSACDTERGRVLAGEGIESFSRAFLAAGAKSTVTTLWRVPDESTAAFMRVFYHHLQLGATRAEALRRAKLRFAHSNTALADPHYWAAFVLTGDGLRPVSTALRWRTLAIALLLVAAAAVAAWIARRG
ncbi:MAG: CHAT domain-containing protein [Acidobacteria bacterium]|nr:CHAT domain-containing protein [Acidobacteriota bacterium]MBV9476797.1 CHAT domain-containing protein [Acidobacteriota bacterium]